MRTAICFVVMPMVCFLGCHLSGPAPTESTADPNRKQLAKQLHLHHHGKVDEESVATGGLFAVADSHTIPAKGMSLAEVVDASLRKSIKNRLDRPHESDPVSFDNASSSNRKLGVPPKQSGDDVVPPPIGGDRVPAPAESEESSPIIGHPTDSGSENSAAEGSAIGDGAEEEVTPVEETGGGFALVDSPPKQTSQQADRPQKGTTEIERNSTTSLAASIVVILKRQGIPDQIIPLSLVQNTPAGDILLQDKDYVAVTSFDATRLKRRKGSEKAGEISLSGLVPESLAEAELSTMSSLDTSIANNANGMVNLMRLDVRDNGKAEQYWFAVSEKSDTFLGQLPGPDLGSIGLRTGDAVNLNQLELIPLVRRSRILKRVRQRELAEGAQTAFQEFMESKAEKDQEMLDQFQGLPMIDSTSSFFRDLPGRFGL